jgi:PAS domain S-box-containing protein
LEKEHQGQNLFLMRLLDASVDGIIAFDRECRYTAWNRAMERISGVGREEALGKCAFDVFPFLRETGEDQYFLDALAGKSALVRDRPYTVPETGREGFFEGHYLPLRGDGGEVVGGVAVIRDITERKRAEAAAQEAHQRLTFHVENTPLAVIEWDRDFRLSRWSPSAEKLFGWKAEEVIGKRIDDWKFVFVEDVQAVYEVTDRQRQGTDRHSVSRNRNYTKDGAVLCCEWYNSVLYDESGKLVSVLSLVLDVTARKHAEVALRESEEQYRLMFESNPQPMWVYDLETLRFLAVNEAAVYHYGYSREEFLAMTIKDIRPPEDVPALTRYLSRATPGLDRAGEWRHRKKDGTVIDVEVTSHELNFAGRRAELILVNDITERKRAEAALRESEDRYRDLVENSHELMCTHDLEGQILSVNPWAARILGYRPSVLIGMKIRDGLLPEHRDEFEDYLRRIKKDGFARGLMQVRTASGEIRIWEYYNTLRTHGVETPIVRGMAHDVTERRQALAREKEARMDAEAANRLKDEFLSTLSHELRTPLTAILGWSKLLLEGDTDSIQRVQALKTIARNAQSQTQLINDLLDVSRIITGKLRLDVNPCELQPVIEAAVEGVRPAAEAKAVRLQVLFDPRAGQVLGDPDRLQQIVWNLLSNAIKFTPGGGRVEIRLERIDSHLEIAVSDTGVGIGHDFLPHVFDRFRQADGSTTREHGGLGLGLAIVRHLVELHGGTVRAQSAGEGLGSTFAVTLPLAAAHDRQGLPGSMERRQSTARGDKSVRVAPSLDGLRVLVVDDESDTRSLVTTMLERCGAEVKAVASAGDALECVESWKPTVMVADIGMPYEDGYALVRKLRSLPKKRGGQTPALALTAYARTEDRVRALSAGYQVHLAKPIDPAELAAAVASLAGRESRA